MRFTRVNPNFKSRTTSKVATLLLFCFLSSIITQKTLYNSGITLYARGCYPPNTTYCVVIYVDILRIFFVILCYIHMCPNVIEGFASMPILSVSFWPVMVGLSFSVSIILPLLVIVRKCMIEWSRCRSHTSMTNLNEHISTEIAKTL